MVTVLRAMPSFKGKSRIARKILSGAQKRRCTSVGDAYGNKLVVPNLLEPVGFSLAVDGSYEPELVEILRCHLTRNTDFVDIGANIGTFTVALAAHARRVFAVEASPAVLPFLVRNVELSGRDNIVVLGYAVSALGTPSVPFYVPPMDHFGMGSSAAQFDAERIMIPARALDEIFRGCGASGVGAVKVDVEGFEAHVFLGATELLRSAHAPMVVFEFCDWAEERAFPGRKGWAQKIMLDAGYNLWLMPEFLRRSAPLDKPITEGFHTVIGLPAQPR
jgi:FkbM family methyltransferase